MLFLRKILIPPLRTSGLVLEGSTWWRYWMEKCKWLRMFQIKWIIRASGRRKLEGLGRVSAKKRSYSVGCTKVPIILITDSCGFDFSLKKERDEFRKGMQWDVFPVIRVKGTASWQYFGFAKVLKYCVLFCWKGPQKLSCTHWVSFQVSSFRKY